MSSSLDDLKALNLRMLKQFCNCVPAIERTISYISVCLGKLTPSGTDLASFAMSPSGEQNPIDVASLNKEYLNYARQVARDINSGFFDGLVILGINMQQARALARLSNQQIHQLAVYYPGHIFQMSAVANRQMEHELHHKAAPHYATGLIAA